MDESDRSRRAGADRFAGAGELYDAVRPHPPDELADVLVSYRGRRPELVVDLGCGTGSSSRWAAGWADEVIGVEPGADMIAVARRRASDRMSFRSGWSHDTGLPDACADVVLAVQALHWMEPSSTFAEVARLLRAGGIFAAVDCDWPPVVGDHVAERAWDRCRRRNRVLESRLAAGADAEALRRPVTDEELDAAQHTGSDAHLDRQLADGVRSWSKSGHLARMAASGRFSWCRELALTALDVGTATRFVGLLRSQGDVQTLVRHGLDDHVLGVDELAAIALERLGDEPSPWRWVYRARVGVVD